MQPRNNKEPIDLRDAACVACYILCSSQMFQWGIRSLIILNMDTGDYMQTTSKQHEARSYAAEDGPHKNTRYPQFVSSGGIWVLG